MPGRVCPARPGMLRKIASGDDRVPPKFVPTRPPTDRLTSLIPIDDAFTVGLATVPVANDWLIVPPLKPTRPPICNETFVPGLDTTPVMVPETLELLIAPMLKPVS